MTAPGDTNIIAFYLYADGTIIANSRSQSVFLLRIRLVNIKERSEYWYNIVVAPSMCTNTRYSDANIEKHRSELLQRHIYQELIDLIHASKMGFSSMEYRLSSELIRLCAIKSRNGLFRVEIGWELSGFLTVHDDAKGMFNWWRRWEWNCRPLLQFYWRRSVQLKKLARTLWRREMWFWKLRARFSG